MVMAVVLAWTVFGMPASLISNATFLGVVFGLVRIAWIIVASIFLYHIAVETGQFQVMKESIAALSADRRLQAILIAFCFGAFLEGTGGGGAPVAIAGAFLIGLGFPPFQAAVLCLLANTAPVAWGAVGNPIRVLAGVTNLPEAELSAMAGRILPPFSFILPLWLVRTMTTWAGTKEVIPAIVVSGLSFAGMQYFWSNHVETGLVDVVSAIFSLMVMVVLLRYWQPQRLDRDHGEPTLGAAPADVQVQVVPVPQDTPVQVMKGWAPFIVASILIFVTGLPGINSRLRFRSLAFPLSGLHNVVLKTSPVVPVPTPE